MTRSKKHNWSFSAGNYLGRVRVFESQPGGIIYGETRDRSLACGTRSISLRHRDKEKAVRWAKEQAAKLVSGEEIERTPTLARVLALYLQHQTPNKSIAEQKADERRTKMWVRTLGSSKDLSKLSMHEWQNFTAGRRSGTIDSDGLPVASDERKAVRDGTVAGDLTFLISVINWACKWREADRYLMLENPARGYPVPVEKNPRRPLVTAERFQKVRAVADQVRMVRGHGNLRRELPTFLGQVLDLSWYTGRRISAILALRFEDLKLSDGPHGSILWPASSDKMGKEWLVPLSPEARQSIDSILAERPGIGKGFLFPSFTCEGEPVRQDAVALWLRSAEILAGVPKQDGSLFHAYRRGWATSRKFFPLVDVAATGGWSDTATLLKCYQQADSETMYRVASEPAKLREALPHF